ncbi:hypothetical protein [Subtercola endophyticus]|uniref:hypothetical protein n=1 Tax=Subtercola endophyticus TaxID=2895559 RepID=UPI001E63B11B|nr:hypothetical protein [Subtercola endophyticus]UFS60648.1 hypothetical protein LQ955_07885 [Subtercola endophyticus]
MTIVPAQPTPAQPQFLVGIGNVNATDYWIVTPAGTWPLADINVTSHDQTSTTTHTPAWAIVMVVIFIWFFLLSLLFLLAKETRVSGYVAVHIQAGSQSFTEQIPVWNAQQRADVLQRVAYLQGLVGQARYRQAQQTPLS